MPEKVEALGVLLVLLPGFCCAYVTQNLAVRRKQTELDKVIEALLFASILYLLTLPFFGYTLPVSWQLNRNGSYQIATHYPHLFALIVGALVLGTIYAASINHDWLLKLMRLIGVTERTARSSIWNDVFQEIVGYVQVTMKDGKRLLGWVGYYSDEVEDCSLFLEDASWVDEEDNEEPIDGPGILLTKDAGIESVMFLNWNTSDDEDAQEQDSAGTSET